MPRALLIVTMEPPAGMEEEFNDWYDLEHFPQRAALPGFQSASRWVCIDGWPRYVALYDMESTSAVTTPEYAAVSGANSTPWSKRVLAKTIGRQRHVGLALGEQDHLQCEAPACSRLLMAGWTLPQTECVVLAQALGKAAANIPGIAQQRAFAVHARDHSLLWFFAAFDAPVTRADLTPLTRAEGRGAGTFNLYVPYFRQSGY